MAAKTSTVSWLDFNEVELRLANARNMLGILETLLNRLKPKPDPEGQIYTLNDHDREQLGVATCQALDHVEHAEAQLTKQLERMGPRAA